MDTWPLLINKWMLLTEANMYADPSEDVQAESTGQFHQTPGHLDHDSQLLSDVLPPNRGEYTAPGPRVLVWEGGASKERLLAVAVQVPSKWFLYR